MQEITITGFLGRDAAVRETADGSRFLSFTIAANSKKNKVTKTTWYDVTCNIERYMGRFADYLKKGASIIVVGELDFSEETGRDGVIRPRLRVSADKIDFNSNASAKENSVSGETNGSVSVAAPAPAPRRAASAPAVNEEEEVPTMRRTKVAPAPAPAPAPAVDDLPDGDEADDLPF